MTLPNGVVTGLTLHDVAATVPGQVSAPAHSSLVSQVQPGAELVRRGGLAVAASGLGKTFLHGGRKLEVLRNINLELRAGEVATVVGASGVGKSTLLHLLGTLDSPTAGRLCFDGQDVTKLSARALAELRNREVGFVFQFHHLLPEFTALENVMMPGLIARLPPREVEMRARAILVRVGLAERLAHRPGELSGGEQQRVALARALVMGPRLLLADEPTGNLDSRTGADMHELFFALNRELGMTILVVTHNDELARRAPRRLRMIDGALVEDTTA